jgi:hypothetical protein
MQTVYLHVDGAGAWAMTRCRSRPCRAIHKYLIAEASGSVVRCKSCGALMDIRDAAKAVMR